MLTIAKITIISSCAASAVSCSTISTFDQKAYENATALKVDAKNTMAGATRSFSSQEAKVSSLQTSLEKAYEYDAGRPRNQMTVKMWGLLLNPQGDLLGGFVSEWKQSRQLKPKYVADKQVQVSRAFDTIIGLESGKIKTADIKN